jgi:hypothetical protein
LLSGVPLLACAAATDGGGPALPEASMGLSTLAWFAGGCDGDGGVGPGGTLGEVLLAPGAAPKSVAQLDGGATADVRGDAQSVFRIDAVGAGPGEGTGAIVEYPRDGSPSRVLVPATNGIQGFAADHDFIYYSERQRPTVVQIWRPAGVTSSQTLAGNEASPMAIAVDDMDVYWVDKGSAAAQFADGSVKRIGKDGTCSGAPRCPVVLATGISLADRDRGRRPRRHLRRRGPRRGGPCSADDRDDLPPRQMTRLAPWIGAASPVR